MRVAGRVAACLPLLALLPLTGCVECDETLILLPDGSGKLHLKIGAKKAAVALLEEKTRGQNGPRPGQMLKEILTLLSDPATLARIGEGVSAWKVGRPEDQGDWIRITLTAYFDDINRVRIRTFDDAVDAQGRPKMILAARLTPSGAGGTLSLSTHLNHSIAEFKATAARAGEDKATIDLMKPVFKDMRFSFRVSAPGPVERIRGFTTQEGRTASLDFDGATMLGLVTDPELPNVRRLDEASRGHELTWSESAATDEERAAFKAELDSAKADWARARGGTAAAPVPPTSPAKPPSLGADADKFTDDEVDRLFIDAQLKVAREQIQRGQKDKARATLEGVFKDFPKAKAAQEAKTLLDGLK